MEKQAITKEKSKSTATVHEIEQTSTELYKVGIYSTAAFAVVVGIWGIICLSSALMSTGGPVALVKSFFGAISGSM